MRFLALTLMLVLQIAQSFKSLSFTRTFASALKAGSFYDIVEKDANGNEVKFDKFKGKVVYGVNVASKCGYTASGYALISKLAALKSKGVEVVLFPCNQFLVNLQAFHILFCIVLIPFLKLVGPRAW